MKLNKTITIILAMAFVVLTCGPMAAYGEGASKALSRIANPASTHCVEHGGKVVIQKRGDGGEFGICVFADNRQCEEWALFRGECPAGGISIGGCVTPEALYCAITGGQYSEEFSVSTGKSRSGTCSFRNGVSCNARDYYDGKCSKYGKASER